jgi:serine/threonine protein kinase/tetratricopeptide (TPR) repeat protein
MEIPGYTIIDTLGEGGMATVYLAIQQSFEREVALKVMSAQLSKNPSFGERFVREARIVARLVHPNIVTVYDVGVHRGNHYLAMEYVPGEDLKQRRSDLSLEQSLTLVRDIARALDYAGSKGYVHRDVKPENIMLHADDGRAVLMDFGIARATDIGSGMTQTGTTMGTPHYMSPEQAKGVAVDPRCDLYSLGVVLFELLTGRVPYDGDSAVVVGIMHVSDAVPRLPEYLRVFQPIIDTVLAKKPEARYQTGCELIAALDALAPEALLAAQQAMTTVPVIEAVPDTDATLPTTPTVAPDAPGVTDAAFRVNDSDSIGDYSDRQPPAGKLRRSVSWLVLLGGVAALGGYFWPSLTAQYQRLTASAKPVVSPVAYTPAPASEGSAARTSSLASDISSEASSRRGSTPVGSAQASELLRRVQAQRAQLEQATDANVDLSVALAQRYRQLRESDLPAERTAGEEGAQALAAWFDKRMAQAVAAANLPLAEQLTQAAQQALLSPARHERYLRALVPLQRQRWVTHTLAAAEGYLADDALSDPPGANAVERYRAVLQVDPDNAQARAGLQAVADRYQQLAQAAEQAGEPERALVLVNRGLAADPDQQALNAQRQRLAQRCEQLAQQMQRVNALMAADQLIAPKTHNAFAVLQQVFSLAPNYQPAQQASEQLEQALLGRIDSMIRGGALKEASQQLASARERYPQSESLLARHLQLEPLLEAHSPQVNTISVASHPIDTVTAARNIVLVADRVIYLGFTYRHFKDEASVVQASLYDGARSVQIAQVPVVVSGGSGMAFFQIERPVSGYSEGGYHVDITYKDERLATLAFRVAE